MKKYSDFISKNDNMFSQSEKKKKKTDLDMSQEHTFVLLSKISYVVKNRNEEEKMKKNMSVIKIRIETNWFLNEQ